MYSHCETMDFINGFTKLGAPVKDLSRFKSLMSALGNPQDRLKFIHIAGTNGKGSTARFCAEALMQAGYKVGEYTSPYITDYTDRIRINGKNIPKRSLAPIAGIVKLAAGDNRDFSQFEITTAIAMLYFKKERCDIVVLETGIGGLLDCTNIVSTTLVSVITSVSFDHTQILGDTITEIASHKAGIIKPHSCAVLSPDNLPETVRVVSEKAKAEKTPLILPDTKAIQVKKSDISGSVFSYKGEEYNIKMPGRHQVMNAVCAIEALKSLSGVEMNISAQAIKKGLSVAAVPARAEILAESPLTILDGAHNPSGAKAFAALLRESAPTPVVLICGMMADKDVKSSAAELSTAACAAVCVDFFADRAISSSGLAKIFRDCKIAALEAKAPKEALERAKELIGESGTIAICGSLYLASEIRKIFKK